MRFHRCSSFALALLLAVALQLGWTFLAGMVIETVGNSLSTGEYVSEIPHIDIDGTLYAYRNERIETGANRRDVKQSYHVLHSSPVELGETKDMPTPGEAKPIIPAGYQSNQQMLGAYSIVAGEYPLRQVTELDNYNYGYQGGIAEVRFPSQAIFLVRPPFEVGGYFALFDRESRSPAGFMGTNGFQQEVPAEGDRFEIDGSIGWPMSHRRIIGSHQAWNYSNNLPQTNQIVRGLAPVAEFLNADQLMIHSSGKLFLVDFRHLTTTNLLPQRDDIQSVALIAKYPRLKGPLTRPGTTQDLSEEFNQDPTDTQPAATIGPSDDAEGLARRVVDSASLGEILLIVRTPRSLLLLHPVRGVVEEFPLPDDVAEGGFGVTSFAGGYAISQAIPSDNPETTPVAHAEGTPNTRVWWIVDGHVVQQTSAKLEQRYSGLGFSPRRDYQLFTFVAGAPVSVAILNFGIVPWSESKSSRTSFAATLSQMTSYIWWAVLLVVIVAACLAWLTRQNFNGINSSRVGAGCCLSSSLGSPATWPSCSIVAGPLQSQRRLRWHRG